MDSAADRSDSILREVQSVAKADAAGAVELAGLIPDPRMRAIALSWGANFSDRNDFTAAINNAFQCIKEIDDPYKAVTALAWPANSAVLRGFVDIARGNVKKCMHKMSAIQPQSSRIVAATLLWQAVYQDPLLSDMIIKFIICDTEQSSNLHWRTEVCLRDLAEFLASRSPGTAAEVLAAMRDPKRKRQTQRSIEAGHSRNPRAFFW